MKKMMIPALAVLAFAAMAEVETTEIKNDNKFDQVPGYWCANIGQMNKRPGGSITQVPEGRTTSCMRLANTKTGYVSLYTRALIPIVPATDSLKLSFHVKGKGTFRVGVYTYAKPGGYVNTWLAPAVTVDSQKWEKKEFTIPGAQLTGPVAAARIAIEMQPGEAELFFDDFSGVKETKIAEK